jgi:hypothetical protein
VDAMRVFDDRGNERDATFEVETFEVENSVAKSTIELPPIFRTGY